MSESNNSIVLEQSRWGSMRVIIMAILIAYFLGISLLCALLACLVKWIIKKYLHRFNIISGGNFFAFVLVWVNFSMWLKTYIFLNDNVMYVQDVIQETHYAMFVIAVIMTCLIARYSGDYLWQKSTICMPTVLALCFAMYCHIIVAPDAQVIFDNTIFPIIIIVLQAIASYSCRKHLDREMTTISRLCLVFCGLSMIVALIGLQFLSTMVIVFWCNMLTGTLLLTTLKYYFDKVIASHHLMEGKIGKTWWMLLVNKVLYPMAWIYTVILSCYLACTIYSLNDFLNTLLATNFSTPIGNITININLVILICWNILAAIFFCHLATSYIDQKTDADKTNESHIFNRNIIRVSIWGVFIINIMIEMGFSLTWIRLGFTALTAGIGFASKEVIENVVYGLTLRNGYINIGDWIVCEGIRGQVKNVGILSTRLDSVEGSVLTISNSRLFHRDFENITLNHGYELLHTPFSIAYGEDIDNVRKVLIDSYKNFDCYDKTRPITVYSKQLSDSWIDMEFRVWVSADQYLRLRAFNVEFVYNTLNAHNIEIPYPVLTTCSK